MRFIQLIEFTGNKDQFERLLDRYLELAGSETKVRRSTLCADRERPGVLLELVEFDSYDDAMVNNDLPGTQQWAEEAGALLADATFRNLDVVGEYTV